MTRIFIALALAGQSFTVQAQAADCKNAQSQRDMDVCADRAFQASDARLNDLYKQITARLKDDADTKKLLTAAQRSWVGFRDAECSFATSAAADGSVHPMLVAQCRTELTDKRAGELKTYLSCAEGDLSCPVPAAN